MTDAADYPSTEETRVSSLRLTHQAIQLEHYTGRSKLNPPLLQTKALSAEESQLQSAAVRFNQQRDAAWLSQVQQNDKPVEWAGFNAQQDPVMEGLGNTPKTLTVRTYARLATCPPRHRYDNACVLPPKYSECLWYAVHPCLSRPPTVSYCMPSAIERPSALDRPHTSPVHDANSHEFHGLHRNIDEIIWRGGSYERSIWLHHQHHQWEGLDQCSMGISSYNRRVAAEFLLKLARRRTRS